MSQPEPISAIVPRALAAASAQPAPSFPRTLPQLVRHFETIEAAEHDDVITELKDLRMADSGLLEVPRLKGGFALNDWSRSQLGALLGIRFDRFTDNAEPIELAGEVNSRLKRASGEVRVRATRTPYETIASDGTVRALVSPSYSAIQDSRIARLLADVLGPEEVKVRRFQVTDKTASYLLQVGTAFRPYAEDIEVGDVAGSILVRNSGTAHSALYLTLALERLICRNGMTVSDGRDLKRVHRGLDDARLRSLIATAVGDFRPRVERAGQTLAASSARLLTGTPEEEFGRILSEARLPQRLLPPLVEAYAKEPIPSAFGISQALTLAAQDMAPEVRIELEQLAGRYVAVWN